MKQHKYDFYQTYKYVVICIIWINTYKYYMMFHLILWCIQYFDFIYGVLQFQRLALAAPPPIWPSWRSHGACFTSSLKGSRSTSRRHVCVAVEALVCQLTRLYLCTTMIIKYSMIICIDI